MSLPWAASSSEPREKGPENRAGGGGPGYPVFVCAVPYRVFTELARLDHPGWKGERRRGRVPGCLQRLCGALELGLEGKENLWTRCLPAACQSPAQLTSRLWASSPHLVRGDCPPAHVTNAQGRGQLGNQEERSSLECGCQTSKDPRGRRGEGRGLWQTGGPVPLLREQQLQSGWPRGRAECPQRDLLLRTRWRPGSPEQYLPTKHQPQNRFTVKHPGGWTSPGRAA